jgi:hypothetical protein
MDPTQESLHDARELYNQAKRVANIADDNIFFIVDDHQDADCNLSAFNTLAESLGIDLLYCSAGISIDAIFRHKRAAQIEYQFRIAIENYCNGIKESKGNKFVKIGKKIHRHFTSKDSNSQASQEACEKIFTTLITAPLHSNQALKTHLCKKFNVTSEGALYKLLATSKNYEAILRCYSALFGYLAIKHFGESGALPDVWKVICERYFDLAHISI